MLSVRSNFLVKFLLVMLVMNFAEAEESSLKPDSTKQEQTTIHALSPTQINVIRAVGRNVLTAKKSYQQNTADNAQLENLRATLDEVIASYLNIQASPTPQKQENIENNITSTQVIKGDSKFNPAMSKVTKLAEFLRTKAQSNMNTFHVLSNGEPNAEGSDMKPQHATMFMKWADELDEILQSNEESRVLKLQALRMRLESKQGAVFEVPDQYGAPTTQIITSDQASKAIQ